MSYVLSVVNQKGGVGKTTTALNVAEGLSHRGYSTLLIDLDPQGNATMGSGCDRIRDRESVAEWLLDRVPFDQVCVQGPSYDLLPSDGRLTEAEIHLLSASSREQRLRDHLAPLSNRYAFVVLDCPPSLSVLTVNALVASSGVLIPVQCEYYAMEGIASLVSTMEEVKAHANPNLSVLGIVRTLYDSRNRLTQEVSKQLIDYFGSLVFDGVIPRNIRLAEAPSHGLPILAYDPSSTGAVAYRHLVSECLARIVPSSQTTEVQDQACVEEGG